MLSQFFKILLMPFTLLYGLVIWLRNRLYDSGFYSSVSFDIPVINVGNLSVGGTGKTPHVEYLIMLLQYQYKVATMSRGYKRRSRGFIVADSQSTVSQIGDEPMQYHIKYPELIVSVAEERMTGIPHLLSYQPNIDVILLDDAFQHRSVKPGINILLSSYESPFYQDNILPYGRLRENRSAYQRADIIIVSKCPQNLTQKESLEIKSKIKPFEHQSVFFSSILYQNAYSFFDNNDKLELNNRKIIFVSGIANPSSILRYLAMLNAQVHILNYPDHHYFNISDIAEITAAVKNWGKDCILLTTEKDATRLAQYYKELANLEIPIMIQPIKISILFDEQDIFDERIFQFINTFYQNEEDENTLNNNDEIIFEEVL